MALSEMEHLRAENAELRRRVETAEADIAVLRTEALERRAEVRAMAEALPAEISRHALIRQMLGDARRHPDKRGVVGRGLRKLGRAPRRAWRTITRTT